MKYLNNLISSLLLFVALTVASLSTYGVVGYPQRYHISPEEEFSNYVEELRQNDVYITLPQGYTPISTRGHADVRGSIGYGAQTNIDCQPPRIGAILEDDSCHVAICLPEMFPTTGIWSILKGKGIEADLRMANNDMNLDVRPLVKIIAEEDMSQYANADTVAMYEFNMFNRPFLEHYPMGVGIYLRKKNHPSLQLRLMLDYNSMNDKEKYIREALDNIHFGDNPSDTYVELEKEAGTKSDFNFPSKYRVFTGILPDINDETLEEINRVRAWCEAHGMKQLPQLDDETIDALNRYKAFRDKSKEEANTIVNNDIPDKEKILSPYMCDSQPHFPGISTLDGNNKYWNWVETNMRYPKAAKEKGIGGIVTVDFVVSTDGSIKDVAVNKLSSKMDASLKQEAIRLVKAMPYWVPGKFNGKAVNVSTSCIVRFDPNKPVRTAQGAASEKKGVADAGKKGVADVEGKGMASTGKKGMVGSQGKVVTGTGEKGAGMKGIIDPEEKVYEMKSVPVMPKFNGGTSAIAEWIQEHIQYPATAATAKIEGRVIVEFIIDKDGTVTSPKVVRGINDALNNEALRVVKTLPRWIPGYSEGKPVKTRYTYPVTFRLLKAK